MGALSAAKVFDFLVLAFLLRGDSAACEFFT